MTHRILTMSKRVSMSKLTIDSRGTISLTHTGIGLVIDDAGCLNAEIE